MCGGAGGGFVLHLFPRCASVLATFGVKLPSLQLQFFSLTAADMKEVGFLSTHNIALLAGVRSIFGKS